MAGTVSTPNEFAVVTPMYTQQSSTVVPTPYATPNVSSRLGNILKAESKALGTVQIMIGVTILSFGIVLALNSYSHVVYSGIVFWGALTYISSGVLTIVAEKIPNKCLVDSALSLNITSAITSGIAFILHLTDLAKGILFDSSIGISVVLLLFSILESIISIYVSVFTWRASRAFPRQQVVYIQNPQAQLNTATINQPITTPNTYESMNPPSVP